ncbi:hypothetical protein KL86APRO_20381 [uncultured Alphaproteobacteria bacterium]|uniref:Uncharacterized protein n=1 Tax=uncultured Alphaproteobacteria bacterium TaxID=91750 RepID=A0A212KJR5_9PROT|nr:hypothetical protein KL86APRO_20381 [uncultured Alphaproteobacteria bacterium]
MKAYCFADGTIEFGPRIPDGALPIAAGPDNTLRREIGVKARLAYNNETLLVPGVPEALDQMSGVNALIAWIAWASPSWRKAGLITPRHRLSSQARGGAS